MQFIKDLLRNLALLLLIALVLFVIFPDIMRQIVQLYGLLFGPVILLLLVAFALPRRRSGRS